ncbi:MAG: hypothetical protein ABL925_17475 [Methylococcales bacterium]
MTTLLNRYAYILIALIPVSIYAMGYGLFEINVESSLNIKKLIVAVIKDQTNSYATALTEYRYRILWLSSCMLSITAYLVALTWSIAIICRCCYRAQVIKIIAVGLIIMAMTLLQIIQADSQSAMFNNIFDTTVQALKVSVLIPPALLQKVVVIISIINVLAAVTPVFILIAICSSIAKPLTPTGLQPAFFVTRMKYLNQGIMMGSLVMLFGIIHMVAWLQWPTTLFANNELNKMALETFSTISQYWGITFTLVLICLYASATLYWHSQTRASLLAMQTNLDIDQWLAEHGFTLSWQKHVLQLSSMMTPFLAGSFSGGLQLLSFN